MLRQDGAQLITQGQWVTGVISLGQTEGSLGFLEDYWNRGSLSAD